MTNELKNHFKLALVAMHNIQNGVFDKKKKKIDDRIEHEKTILMVESFQENYRACKKHFADRFENIFEAPTKKLNELLLFDPRKGQGNKSGEDKHLEYEYFAYKAAYYQFRGLKTRQDIRSMISKHHYLLTGEEVANETLREAADSKYMKNIGEDLLKSSGKTESKLNETIAIMCHLARNKVQNKIKSPFNFDEKYTSDLDRSESYANLLIKRYKKDKLNLRKSKDSTDFLRKCIEDIESSVKELQELRCDCQPIYDLNFICKRVENIKLSDIPKKRLDQLTEAANEIHQFKNYFLGKLGKINKKLINLELNTFVEIYLKNPSLKKIYFI